MLMLLQNLGVHYGLLNMHNSVSTIIYNSYFISPKGDCIIWTNTMTCTTVNAGIPINNNIIV
jgi:hypothetical protein